MADPRKQQAAIVHIIPETVWVTQAESQTPVVDLLPDFVPGPLDKYRAKSQFSWKKMRILFEGEDMLRVKMSVWTALEKDPVFAQTPHQEFSRDEFRRLTFLRARKLMEYEFYDENDTHRYPLIKQAYYMAIGSYDWSLCTRLFLSNEFFTNAIAIQGKQHQYQLIDDLETFKLIGCFCMTELSHGSNTRGIGTIATYDPQTKGFYVNTPTREATKCWVGNLGQTATHSVVYAQLYTPDGECHGLHSFIVPLRDTKTLLPLDGVTLGDLGPKIGLDGLDNGFAAFDNVYIPRESLLSRISEVTESGRYVSKIENQNKRFSASLGSLSFGRIMIIGISVASLQKCLPIAVRYSAVRKQFGPPNKEEMPILEYQLQQWRLIPYVAATYVLKVFGDVLQHDYVDYHAAILFDDENYDIERKRTELHILSSAGKPYATWLCRDAIQECREACGGNGYLKASGFGILRGDHDACCTYEGENNVLIQQTSNQLLSMFQKKEAGNLLESFDILNQTDAVLQQQTVWRVEADLANVEVALQAYRWLTSYLLQESQRKYNDQLLLDREPFTAHNNSQVYYCRSLSLAYIEYVIINKFYDFCCDPSIDKELVPVLQKICSLFALWSLEKHLSLLYAGGYFQGPEPSRLIREEILNLCLDLKDQAVSLVDAFSPPDFILNSVIGMSDGKVYERLIKTFTETPGSMERPTWWETFMDKPDVRSIKAKL